MNTAMFHDPSLTAWGVSLVGDNDTVHHVECIKTKSESNRPKFQDDPRRLRKIGRRLNELIDEWDVQFLGVEYMAGGRSSRTAKTAGFTQGIIAGVETSHDLPVEYYTEQSAKKANHGRVRVAKDDMYSYVDEHLDVPWPDAKFRREAAADSLYLYLAAKKESSSLPLLLDF